MRAGALGVALLLAAAAEAGAAEVHGLVAALDGHRVEVSFRLEGAFDPQLVERVESGLPTSLTFEIELLGDRKRWFDRGIQTARLTVVGMYDAVRREYLVNFKLDGRLLESRMVQDLAELERAMTGFDGLPVFTLERAPEGRRLLVRVRAELGFHHLLGFIPTRVTTDWAESRKFRPPADLPR
jgi:hypothetical protein